MQISVNALVKLHHTLDTIFFILAAPDILRAWVNSFL